MCCRVDYGRHRTEQLDTRTERFMQGQGSERKQSQRTKKEGEKQVKFTSIELHVEELMQSTNHKEDEMKLSVSRMSGISNA